MSYPGPRTPEQRAAAGAAWTPERRARQSALLREVYKQVWTKERRAAHALKFRQVYGVIKGDPQGGLGYLDRGVYCTFEESWKRARRHLSNHLVRITKMSKWKLRRTRQCAKCPWKVTTNPHDIPNGYSEQLHAKLACTIAKPGVLRPSISAMACHKSKPGKEMHCIGWLVNQIGPGNNIPLRIRMMSCENGGAIQLDGEQHKTFEDTLPT